MTDRGGEVVTGKTVESVEGGAKAAVVYADGTREEADKVVVASGAWLSDLVRDHGVKVPVRKLAAANSPFSVATPEPIKHSVYLPAAYCMHSLPGPLPYRRHHGIPRPRRSTDPTSYRIYRQQLPRCLPRRRPR